MKNKIKAILKRGKLLVVSAAIAVTSAMTAVVACAEETVETTTTATTSEMLTTAGNEIVAQLTGIVDTILPMLIGIMGGGLVIFGVIKLVSLAKKIFGKVAG